MQERKAGGQQARLTLRSIKLLGGEPHNAIMRAMNSPTSEAAARSDVTLSATVTLPRNFGIRTLGEDERTVVAEPLKLVGKRLIVRLSSALPVGAAVRIDYADSFLLGEVLGSWHDGGTFAAIELEHQLTGLRELQAAAQRPFWPAVSELRAVRQSA